jgi:uncharacterized protein (TIGR02452 family)
VVTQKVTVFRDDSFRFLDEPFQVDFLTMAAPNAAVYRGPCEKVNAAMCERVKRIVTVAAVASEANALVLGAFGCGAFGNEPLLTARAFREALSLGGPANRFKVVVFPIIGGPRTPNAVAFQEVFGPMQGV